MVWTFGIRKDECSLVHDKDDGVHVHGRCVTDTIPVSVNLVTKISPGPELLRALVDRWTWIAYRYPIGEYSEHVQ
jgi:hypothetical protein